MKKTQKFMKFKKKIICTYLIPVFTGQKFYFADTCVNVRHVWRGSVPIGPNNDVNIVFLVRAIPGTHMGVTLWLRVFVDDTRVVLIEASLRIKHTLNEHYKMIWCSNKFTGYLWALGKV